MTTTLPAALRAPFSAGGASAIDAQLANRLLSLALEAGGDYADIYFEFRVSADYVLEEEQIKTLGRGITLGLGVRVTKGDATGYAYTEDLTWDRMAHAARTAGQIARGGGSARPVEVKPVTVLDLYPISALSLTTSAHDKLALLRAADKSARAFDPRIIKVEASFSEGIKELLVVTSDGRWARDVQPMIRFGVRAVAQDGTKLQAGSSGGGGRYGMDYFAQATKDAASHGAGPRGSRSRCSTRSTRRPADDGRARVG
jgi:TldD protein